MVFRIQEGIGTHQQVTAHQIGLTAVAHAGAFLHDGVQPVDGKLKYQDPYLFLARENG